MQSSQMFLTKHCTHQGMGNELSFNTTIITLKMSHHARLSGYDRLIDFLNLNVISTNKELTILQRITAKCLRPIMLRRCGSIWYHRENLITELRMAQQWMKNNNQIFHFLYGENSYRFLGCLKSVKSRNNYIISTYHTPPDRFREVVNDRNHLRKLDAAIIVSTVQKEFFTGLLGKERVFYVPHGIDTEYFQPLIHERDSEKALRCIFVGNHLRDFETLAQVMKNLFDQGASVNFVVVAPKEKHHYFYKIGNSELYSSVTDSNLLALYQSADLLVLPLLDCTANNALLEGMACGLPVVSTDLMGVKDYVNERCSLLAPKRDANALANAILALQKDEPRRLHMGLASRERALDFQWEKIAKKMHQVYQKTCLIN